MGYAQPSETGQQETRDLRSGETLTLTAGGASVKCMVFHASGNSAILTPMQVNPSFQSALNNLPATATVRGDDGLNSVFVIRSNGTVQAFSGDLQTGTLTNRRRAFRITVDFQVRATIDGQNWHILRGLDISTGGLQLNNPGILRLTIGQMLLMSIHLPECERIMAGAVIKRITPQSGLPAGPTRLGLQFTNLALDDARKLAQFIYKFQSQLTRGQNG